MIFKIIEKILIKFLFKIREKKKENKKISTKTVEKVEKKEVATPKDFKVYTDWSPSKETLREYEIRQGIKNQKQQQDSSSQEELPHNEHSLGSEMKVVVEEAIIGGVVEELVKEEYDEVKEKLEEILEDIEDKLEEI